MRSSDRASARPDPGQAAQANQVNSRRLNGREYHRRWLVPEPRAANASACARPGPATAHITHATAAAAPGHFRQEIQSTASPPGKDPSPVPRAIRTTTPSAIALRPGSQLSRPHGTHTGARRRTRAPSPIHAHRPGTPEPRGRLDRVLQQRRLADFTASPCQYSALPPAASGGSVAASPPTRAPCGTLHQPYEPQPQPSAASSGFPGTGGHSQRGGRRLGARL